MKFVVPPETVRLKRALAVQLGRTQAEAAAGQHIEVCCGSHTYYCGRWIGSKLMITFADDMQSAS